MLFAGDVEGLGRPDLRFGELVRTLEDIVRRCCEVFVRAGEVLLTGGEGAFFS